MEFFRNQIRMGINNSIDPDQAEIVLSNKGGPKLIDNGFMYTMHKKQTNNIRWRCVLRSSQCRGSLVTSTDFKLPRVRMEHNHGPDYAAARLARTRYMALKKPAAGRLAAANLSQEENSNVMMMMMSFEDVPPVHQLLEKIKDEPTADYDDRQTEMPEKQPIVQLQRRAVGQNIKKISKNKRECK